MSKILRKFCDGQDLTLSLFTTRGPAAVREYKGLRIQAYKRLNGFWLLRYGAVDLTIVAVQAYGLNIILRLFVESHCLIEGSGRWRTEKGWPCRW